MSYRESRFNISEQNMITIMDNLGGHSYYDRGNYLEFYTICHNLSEDESSPNLSYYKDTHLFYCYSHCHTFDVFDLIQKRIELGFLDIEPNYSNIMRWITNVLQKNISIVSNDNFKVLKRSDYQQEFVPELPFYNEKVLEVFDYSKDLWKQDHIDKKALKKYNISFFDTNTSIVIPHYNINSQLIGIRQRFLKEEDISAGKYRPLRINNNLYNHSTSLNVYGLDKVKESVQKYKYLILAEAEKSCLQSESYYGNDNVVSAVCGNNLNKWQMKIIMKETAPREVILAFDKGIEEEKLKELCKKYNHLTRMSYLYDDIGLLKDKESPFDRIENLSKLMERRKFEN